VNLEAAMKLRELPFLTEEAILYLLAAILVLAMIVMIGTIGGIVLVPFVAVPAMVLIYFGHRAGQHRHT
jgi:hypothetical protein